MLKRFKTKLKRAYNRFYLDPISDPIQLTARRNCGIEGLEFPLFSVSDGIDWSPLPAWEHIIHHSRIALKRLLGLDKKNRIFPQRRSLAEKVFHPAAN